MSSSKLGSSGVLFRGTKWTRQLFVVKYSSTCETVGKYDEKSLSQVIDAIGGDGTVAELECYRHPLLEVFPNARVTPAVGFKNWVLGIKYRFIEAVKPLNDDQEFKKTLLNEIKRTDPILYHSFVVFKIVQDNSDSTKDLWCSIEKNSTCLLIQCSENKDDVKFKNSGEKRIDEVKALSHDFEHVGQKSVHDLLHFLRDEKELDKKYHLLKANCQIFAENIISNFKIDSPSSRDWYRFQKIIYLWSSLDWAITPISCPFEFSIVMIPSLTEIGHMPSKMSRNYRLTFRKTLSKVIEKLRDVVNTGSVLGLRHEFPPENEVDNDSLRMILKGLEEFSNVLEEEIIKGFVFLFWMGRSKYRLIGHEKHILTNVTRWHTESMAEEYKNYKLKWLRHFDETVAEIERQTMKTLSPSTAVKKVEKNARPAIEEEINAYFSTTQKSFEESMSRDLTDGDSSATFTGHPFRRIPITLANYSIAQIETMERKPLIEEIERLSNIEILRRLYQESIESDGKISPSNERDSDEDDL